MEWVMDNWIWIVGAVVLVYLINVFTRKPATNKPARRPVQRAPAQRSSNRQLSQQDADRIFNALLQALENVVDDTIGKHYSRQDRQKIAMGMLAVMATENISLEQLVSNKMMFLAVMAKSVDALTKSGVVTQR